MQVSVCADKGLWSREGRRSDLYQSPSLSLLPSLPSISLPLSLFVLLSLALAFLPSNFHSQHNLESPEKKGHQLKNYLYQIALQACLWTIFLIVPLTSEGPPTVRSTTLRQLSEVCKKAS